MAVTMVGFTSFEQHPDPVCLDTVSLARSSSLSTQHPSLLERAVQLDSRPEYSENAKVSIIVPVFNSRPFLERCIDSILAQSYSAMEVILVDDGSTDESGAICHRYSTVDPRVITIHQPNAGAGAARNSGLGVSTGEYVVFVDSDDFIDREMVDVLVRAATVSDSLVVCGVDEFIGDARSFRKLVDLDGGGLLPISTYLSRYVAPLGVNVFVGSQCNKLYSGELLRSIGLNFEEGRSFAEDYFFNLEYLHHVDSVLLIDQCLYHIRRDSPGSLCKRSFVSMEDRWSDYDRLFSELRQLLDSHSLVPSCRTDLSNIVEFGLRDSIRRAFRLQAGFRIQEPAQKLEKLWHQGLVLSPNGRFQCRDPYMKMICHFSKRGWFGLLAIVLKLHAYILTIGKWTVDHVAWTRKRLRDQLRRRRA